MTGAIKEGDLVAIQCYQSGCRGVMISNVTLGQKYGIHPYFVLSGGVGRITWDKDNATLTGFSLWGCHGGSGGVSCPKCRTQFGSVIVVEQEGAEPIIFGYDSEPA